MLQLAKPRTGKDKRYTIEAFPEKYKELVLYCLDDVLMPNGISTTGYPTCQPASNGYGNWTRG